MYLAGGRRLGRLGRQRGSRPPCDVSCTSPILVEAPILGKTPGPSAGGAAKVWEGGRRAEQAGPAPEGPAQEPRVCDIPLAAS